jgi:hypothetical protein
MGNLISIIEVEAIVKSLAIEIESEEGQTNIETLYTFIKQEKARRKAYLESI